MITKREAHERGRVRWSWLDAKHSFSFGSYFDPKWMGFSELRVINDDLIDPKKGFETHPHKDMEIVSFIIEGALEHKDTMGNHSIIEPGEIQVMSAGEGIEHSEFNPQVDKSTHSLQIWIKPNVLGVKPSYQSYKYPQKLNELNLIVAPCGKNVATINQDVEIFLGEYKDFSDKISLDKTKNYWLQQVSGFMTLNDVPLEAGDGLAISEEAKITLEVNKTAEFLLFKLP